MNLIIERLNGQSYSLADLGIKTIDFAVSAPEPRIDSETAEGRDGYIDLDATYGPRRISVELLMKAIDLPDYPLLRNEVFRIFASREQFYVMDDREPGKRWKVRLDGTFTPDQMQRYGRIKLTLISASPYAESVGTSLTTLDFEQDGVWQIGQGLVVTDDLAYVHTTSSFSVYNPGDVAVNPRNMPLVIEYTGASSGLEIRNLTTLETWSYSGSTGASDRLKIDRTRSLKNDVVPIFGDTNRRLITLAPGWNEFELANTSGSFEISFDFRFYYL